MNKIGFIQGTFDMFHIGHLNLIKKAKEMCDYLIVAVNTDELVQQYKKKTPIFSFKERFEIVKAIKYVDKVVIANDRDKLKAYNKYKFDYLIMGDDWKGTDFYNKVSKDLEKVGVKVIYFPYTKSVSSTKLVKTIEILLEEKGDKNEN